MTQEENLETIFGGSRGPHAKPETHGGESPLMVKLSREKTVLAQLEVMFPSGDFGDGFPN